MNKLLFSKPGSLTMYTTSGRDGLPAPSNCPDTASPSNYTVDNYSIKKCPETLSPFNTTEELLKCKIETFPGPGKYNPEKLLRNVHGTVLMNWGDRFPPTRDDTVGPGPAYSVKDPWEQMRLKIYHECNTKRPRVKFPKYVSNNVPSLSHPLDIRCFIKGGDQRMYPWRKPKRTYRQPGPIYNTFNIHTSQSHIAPEIDFTAMSQRGEVFPPKKGAGPAEYYTRLPLDPNGGIFLSKSCNPQQSALRLLDIIVRDAKKPPPGPGSYSIIRDMDKASSKACTAPFKSKIPTLGFPKKLCGPNPMDYFKTDMTIRDLDCELWPYPRVFEPPRAPFLQSEEKFFDTKYREENQRPSPNQYYIRSFTDNIWLEIYKHLPALPNQKLGFLTSSAARGKPVLNFRLDAITTGADDAIPLKWRSVQPKNCKTYPYNGGPTKMADSPGPIYETTSGYKATRGKKDWFNPRYWTGTGFNNSGCERKTMTWNFSSAPGPKYSLPSFIPGPGGRINMTGQRTMNYETPGPGPNKLLHEKTDSMWRATQLGTFNTHLKGIGVLRPSAGGFHPYGPIDQIADKEGGYIRLENCPEAHMHQ